MMKIEKKKRKIKYKEYEYYLIASNFLTLSSSSQAQSIYYYE